MGGPEDSLDHKPGANKEGNQNLRTGVKDILRAPGLAKSDALPPHTYPPSFFVGLSLAWLGLPLSLLLLVGLLCGLALLGLVSGFALLGFASPP